MKSILLSIFLAFACLLPAAEETGFSWPLGPIGGKMRLWTGESFVRVSELTIGAPGSTAGLQVNDFILGAFGRDFDVLGGDFEGVVRQLGDAIEHAECNDGVLPLKVLRSGTGVVTVTVNLPALGALDPAYPLTSAKYAATYEYACAQLHARVMADADGDLGYPTGFVALSLLGHPNWNDLTGAKPYRLSVNKLRDWAISRINNGQFAPVESKYFDGTANPNYQDPGLENWSLGQAVMYLSEYVAKTGEQATYQTVLQRGAVMMANRIQNWAQPANGGTANLTYEVTRGATGHGGVTGDYTHQWYVGINMAGLHLFNGLAMAKRAGADMTERPRDGHYFGHALDPGDAVPSNISPALPATITLPRGANDSRVLPHIDNVSAAPLTKIITVDAANNPFYYDTSLDQKFWIQWDCLTRSTGSSGYVAYASVTGAEYDAGGRTPGSLLGMKVYHGNTAPPAADQAVMDLHTNYIIAAHNRHLNAHAYNMGGGLFTAMVMPWFSDRDQRFFWDNWKFYANLMRQPDGSLQYFRGRPFGDAYQDESLVVLVNNALPRSVALGGLPHVPGYDTNRVFARFKQPLLEWPTPAARKRRITGNSESFTVELVDSGGAVISPASVTAAWSVVSGPVTSGIFSNAATLNTTATFPQAGIYRLKLDASAAGLSTTELIDIEVMPGVPATYAAGQADYKVYGGITGTSVASLTGAPSYPNSPTQTSVLSKLEGTFSGNDYGSTITTTIVAPETGTYRFYIASDDDSSLRFNASGTAANGAVQIASVSGWTNPYQWNKYGSQQSAAITLTAGQQYYLQALHKEGGGGDHLAIAWTTPSNSTITVIGAPYIARELPAASTPAILTQPQPVVANLGDNVSLPFTTSGSDLALYQWRLNGSNFGTPQTTPTLILNNIGARLAGTWDCVFTDGSTVLTTDTATITINGMGSVTNGGLWQEVFTGVSGGAIDSLLTHPSYPLLSTSSSVLTEPRTSTLGDDYGQRWSGWLIPSSSGNYRFYAAADDQTRLYLSPTPYESHKQLIHSITSATGELSWSSRSPSAWIPLVAGQRYYVEFLHKEGGGGDHAAFTWQKEGDPVPTNGTGLIPSGNLQYVTGGGVSDAATAPPYATADIQTLPAANNASLLPLANDLDAQPASLTITAITQPTIGTLAIAPDGKSLIYTNNSDTLGTATATYTITNSLGLTATADLTINLVGGLWQQRYNNITGNAVADLTGNAAFPNSPSSEEIRTNAYISQLGSNFGLAWTGWVVPTVSGNYRFYMTCDKAADLYFSTTPYASHQQRIISRTSFVSERNWSTSAMSDYFPLVAGQRYYLRALLKESSGNDQLALAWQREGDPAPTNGGGEMTALNLRARIGGYHVDGAQVAPLALDDSFSASTNTSAVFEFDPLANDLDAQPLTITAVTAPALGTLTISPDGKKLRFLPGTTTGTTTATYTVSDGILHSTATVTLNIRDLAAGLLAHWRMDEMAGYGLQDAAAGNHATLTGGTRVSGRDGNAVAFNGTSSDKATAPAASCTGLTDQVTIAFWSLGGAASANTTAFIAKDASGNRVLNIHLPFGTTVHWDAGSSGSSYDRISKSANAAELTTTWAHWAFTKNATTGEMAIYRNGTLWHSGTGRTRTFPAITSVSLGWDGGSIYHNGSLDDFRIYNTALSASDIALLASATPLPLVLLGNAFSITESAATGAAVGTISATPTAPATSLSYAITGGNAAGRFAIDPAAGSITVAAPLDFETTSSYALTITATDNASPPRSNTALATVAVTNANETPSFTTVPLTRPNGAVGISYTATLAGSATDPDLGDTLTYSKVAGPAWLNIATSGALTGTPDMAGTQAFTVRATDAAGLFAETSLTIVVADSTLYSGLGGWWRMNEASGTTTADSSGSGRTATMAASPNTPTWTTGRLGGGIAFNGTSQFLTIPGSATPTTQTVSAWIRPTTTTGIQTILSQQGAFSFRTNGTGLRFTTLGVRDYDTGALLTPNAWQHVAVTFTPNTTGGCKIYLNGVLRYTSTSTTSLSINTNTNAWQLGRTNTSEHFGGSLDEVRLYTRVLTAAEIAGIFSTSTPFEEWRNNSFTLAQLGDSSISGPMGDADNDGIENLVEYALNVNPHVAAPLHPRIISDLDSNQYNRLTITKNPNATDVTYSVQVSGDLTNWSSTPTVILENTATTLQVRDTQSTSDSNRRFIRLLVTQP